VSGGILIAVAISKICIPFKVVVPYSGLRFYNYLSSIVDQCKIHLTYFC
jgi:hypothetical protein